ncbi:hypothetical protein A2703_03455 [Candidatus Collierbacteria bacterium RIFCSPHIGHO2_01_FULL_50_25]|uniref:Peptidase M20 dimerisation domain-containing protein n=1 Tax=Candidatus Collierbacteria bacterium RIFCSPHIGHO2_01_FULL_50_25 TaxID=1817722 RepID=A0A1F5EW66_9BACT|nr:MAG: hypothetical protein A2703_03455 [Candidatus Collierbacteria bacterium RIFCSPHIGHO2_01_FULL_50_25]
MSLTQNLKQLIKFRTTPENILEIRKAMSWVVRVLPKNLRVRRLGFFTHPTLFVTTHVTKRPKILLAAHIDVVPGAVSLFRPKIIGDKLFGRGAFDMKFAIASYLTLANEIKSELQHLNFGLLITSDEEIGGANGSEMILRKGFLPKVCILPDGANNFDFERRAKGFFTIKIECQGKSAHGSRTWEGNNAIERLVGILELLKKNLSLKEEPCGDPQHNHNTLNISAICGGGTVNQIPDYATATVDIRFISHREKIEKAVRSLENKYEWLKLKKTRQGPVSEINPNNYYHQEFLRILKTHFRQKARFIVSHGTSDARFFTAQNIPTIVTRPMGGGHHGEKEWISLTSLNIFHRTLKEFVVKIGKY